MQRCLKRSLFFILVVASLLAISGCAVKRGIYHEVQRGQTLWQISRAYNVDLDLILRVNDIENARQVQVGRMVMIPGAKTPKQLETRRRANRNPSRSSGSSGSASDGRISPEPTSTGQSSQSSSQTDRITRGENASGSRSSASAGFQPVWPCKGRIVSRFDKGGDPTKQGLMLHVPPGSSVKAMESGRVRLAEEVDEPPELKQLGNLVMIFHNDNFVSVYAHLDKIDVQKGDDVNRGQTIGTAGKTGYVDQVSCAFQIRYKVEPRDPLLFLGDPP